MVSELESGLSDLGLKPGQRHFVVFIGKTLCSHSASLHPEVRWVLPNSWHYLTESRQVACSRLMSNSGESSKSLDHFMPRIQRTIPRAMSWLG